MDLPEIEPGFWVHGSPAHDLAQVVDFLAGDDHDKSKVKFYDGEFWYSVTLD